MHAKTRFLSVYIDPKTGRERIGPGADAQCFHEYANVKNVIFFGLRKDDFPPGQYNIYIWPRGRECATMPVTTAYKRV